MPFLARCSPDTRADTISLSATSPWSSEALLAVEHVTRAVLLRRGRDIGEIVARLALGMREGEQCFTGRDLRQHIALHRVACAAPQEAAAEHDRREVRLERERAAEGFHHDHGLDRPAADARRAPRRTGAR